MARGKWLLLGGLVVGLGVASATIIAYFQEAQQQGWPSTQATITSARVATTSTSMGSGSRQKRTTW